MVTSRKQYDAHVRDLRQLQKKVEADRKLVLDRERRKRYRLENNNHDGRPAVDKLSHHYDDPLLEILKEGKR